MPIEFARSSIVRITSIYAFPRRSPDCALSPSEADRGAFPLKRVLQLVLADYLEREAHYAAVLAPMLEVESIIIVVDEHLGEEVFLPP